MEHEELKNGQNDTLTELGKLLGSGRKQKGQKNMKKLAEVLGISVSLLSEIENGKKKEGYPDIDFLVRCMDYFGWRILDKDGEEEKRRKIEKTLDLFEKGLLSADNFSLNMKYFHSERKKLLVQIIVLLLLLPDKIFIGQKSGQTGGLEKDHNDEIEEFGEAIDNLYNSKKKKIIQHRQINDLDTPPPKKIIKRPRKSKSP